MEPELDFVILPTFGTSHHPVLKNRVQNDLQTSCHVMVLTLHCSYWLSANLRFASLGVRVWLSRNLAFQRETAGIPLTNHLYWTLIALTHYYDLSAT